MAVLLLITTLGAAADAREAALDRAEMRELVHGFLKSWETGNAGTFADSLHDDVVFAYPGDRLGKTRLVAMFKRYRKEKRDIRIYLGEEFFVDGGRFALAYQFAATDHETGKRQAVGTGVVGRIEAGRIILFKEYFDENVAALQYAGELPLDEGRVAPWPASIWLRPETID
jgi:ketosteroid isomerase-like protein